MLHQQAEVGKSVDETSGLMKEGCNPQDQEDASQILKGKSQSGSAKLYSSGLSQAAQQFKGREVTAANAITLIQSLLGGGQAPPEPNSSKDPLGSLLAGLVGGAQKDDDGGFDAGDLLGAGMAFLSSKQSGKNDMESIVSAIMSTSQMGTSAHRSESGSLVTSTLLNVISSFTG